MIGFYIFDGAGITAFRNNREITITKIMSDVVVLEKIKSIKTKHPFGKNVDRPLQIETLKSVHKIGVQYTGIFKKHNLKYAQGNDLYY